MHAQVQATRLDYGGLVYLKNHVGVTGATSFWLPGPQRFQSSAMHTRPFPGFSIGVQYHLNLHRNVSVNSGLTLGMQSIRFAYNSGSTGAKQSITYATTYSGIPINMEVRAFVNHRQFVQFNTGATLGFYSRSRTLVSTYMSANELLEMQLGFYGANPQIAVQQGVAYGIVLKNLNIILIGLEYQHGIKPFTSVNYEVIDNDLTVDTATSHLQNNMISLKVTCQITRAQGMKENIERYLSDN